MELMTIVGVASTLVGAYLMAYEVFNKFHGEMFGRAVSNIGAPPHPPKTKEFLKWERKCNVFRVLGLILITLGSIMQIWALCN